MLRDWCLTVIYFWFCFYLLSIVIHEKRRLNKQMAEQFEKLKKKRGINNSERNESAVLVWRPFAVLTLRKVPWVGQPATA